ncbi:MAG TPA: DUF2007 domain-containing protein [Solirubrobacteraceae bacterium]|nr:DUF2007 domain-containing protein [Solirubrobacteraceae bacterium]
MHDDLRTLTTASNQAEAEEIGERLSKAGIRWMPDMDSGVRFGASSNREIHVAAEDYDRAVEVLRTEAPERPVSVGGAFEIGDRVAHRDQPDDWGTIVAILPEGHGGLYQVAWDRHAAGPYVEDVLVPRPDA